MRCMSNVPAHPEQTRLVVVDPPTDTGLVSLFIGCMFSGKTSELLRRIERFPSTSVLAIKHTVDNRYASDAIVSHSGKSVVAVAVRSSNEIEPHVKPDTQFVAIDEAHFFDAGLVDVVARLTSRGVNVALASLEPDSWGRPFPINAELRRMADECSLLTAKCARCAAEANCTQRLTPIVDGCMVVGPEHYESRCRRCWKPPVEVK